MSTHYSIGDIIDVHIEKIVPRGFGIAFVQNLTVLVPLSAPGDDLRVQITEIKKRLAFAEIVEIRKPGPQRIIPPCKYFGRCGGCDFQQMSYAAQLEAKVGIIRDSLLRIGKIECPDHIPIIPSPYQFYYRSKARWHIDRDKQATGYFARDSHDVTDVVSCPILTPEMQSMLDRARESVERNTCFNQSSEVAAATDGAGNTSVLSMGSNELPAELWFDANELSYAFSAETFFQANKFLIAELIDAATGGASGKTAFDLYCGIGLFALPMAKYFEKVIAVEEHKTSVDFAKKNVANAGLHNVKIVGKSVGRFLSENNMKNTDFILIDPPRAGTEKNVIASIAAVKTKEISYVSCEPSILARDLRVLIDAGYEMEKIVALDMFPQTHHIETVVRLKRN